MFDVNDTLFISVPAEEDQENPWLRGAWRPQGKEYAVSGDELTIIGSIPEELDGIYVRNTHNNATTPTGIYHPFDGDGMLHAIRFRDGTCEYRNAFVRTTGFLAEQGAKKALWPGILQPQEYQRRGWGSMGSMKDNAGTDVIAHAGHLIATMSQGSEPWCLSPDTLETLGPNKNWAKLVPDGLSSHYKVDNATGEMTFFNYPQKAPFMNYGVVNKADNLVHYVPIELPGPRWPHDLGMTEHYSILHDLPYFFDEELLKNGIHKGSFHDDIPARFGVIPRYGTSADVRWFEAKPCWVMHLSNCFEDGDWVVQDGCIWDNLVKPPVGVEEDAHAIYARIRRNVDMHPTGAHLYRWMFNMVTGVVREFPLDDEVSEFPVISNDVVGRPYRYSYNALFERGEWHLNGLKRYDLHTGNAVRLEFGPGRWGSEPAIARPAGSSAEDDGYCIVFITDLIQDRSECAIYRADDLTGDPVCTVILPERISVGTHSCWVEGDRIAGEGRAAR
ncbi:carotenoid oxygenase family protein [Rhodococcus qingshengii]|uniref:carotenoid oxygenase family protein n=1 Tax=Rhodococcus qingshengii TaxID=334542 RepID=UPI001C5F09C5|nr:carotenoid oxygenase family protein [Rhodococcus qingshengii]MBW4815032.1 carotenoid oxygenase family protein [Rhodococcus qingshengii]